MIRRANVEEGNAGDQDQAGGCRPPISRSPQCTQKVDRWRREMA